jgi:hypothetical protein
MNKNYKIDVNKWGLSIEFHGRICRHDLEAIPEEFINNIIKKLPKNFGLLLNLINIEHICGDTAKLMAIANAYLVGRGLNRSAIIYDSCAKLSELNRALINAGGINKNYRYISTFTHANYMDPAMDWLLKGIEP